MVHGNHWYQRSFTEHAAAPAQTSRVRSPSPRSFRAREPPPEAVCPVPEKALSGKIGKPPAMKLECFLSKSFIRVKGNEMPLTETRDVRAITAGARALPEPHAVTRGSARTFTCGADSEKRARSGRENGHAVTRKTPVEILFPPESRWCLPARDLKKAQERPGEE